MTSKSDRGFSVMAKQKKSNLSDIPPVPREAIGNVAGEDDFVELLRRELEWPILPIERLKHP